MTKWLTLKFCCNYFIRNNNMMDHLVDTDVTSDVAVLYAALASRNIIDHTTTLCAEEESFTNTLTSRSDMPTWILRSILICDRILNTRDNFRDLGSNDFALELHRKSVCNQWISIALPVLLSTQWTAVYDAELQALLGFCSLCAFVSNRTDAGSVCLAVCPVQFVLYLNVRCALDQRCTVDVWRSITDFYTYNKQAITCVRGFYMSTIILSSLLHSIIASNS